MLGEDQVAQMKEEVEQDIKRIAEIVEEHGKAKSEQADHHAEISDHEESIKGIRGEIHSLEKTRIQLADEHNELQRRVQPKEKMLVEDAHEKEVEALFIKQPTFWALLEGRIDHHQEEMNAGFENRNPDIASEKLAEKFHEIAVQSNSFSPLAGALRSGAVNYKDFMRSLCEKQLAGERLTAQQKRQTIQIIDNCLLSQEVEPHWS